VSPAANVTAFDADRLMFGSDRSPLMNSPPLMNEVSPYLAGIHALPVT
jgi:hypothetical protein